MDTTYISNVAENLLGSAEIGRPSPLPFLPYYETVSLFSGCGGLDLGFKGNFDYKKEHYPALPFNFLKAYDHDARCVETYTRNVGEHIEKADLESLSPAEMPRADVLVGGFPCQEFSSCGPQGGLDSQRGQLYKVFIRYMRHHRPRVVVAENVHHLARMQKGAVLNTIMRGLRAVGYRFAVWTLYAPDYGVPQARKRLFLVGVRGDLPGQPSMPEMTHAFDHRSVDWAISDLEHVVDESVPNQSEYFKANRAKRGSGQGDEISKAGSPAYTVRANVKSRVQFHYSLSRRLTMRECARLQTFPDTFTFTHKPTYTIQQIGNAVPPVLAHAVGMSIADYLQRLPSDTIDVTRSAPAALDVNEF